MDESIFSSSYLSICQNMFNQGFGSTSTYSFKVFLYYKNKEQWLDENLKTKFTGETVLETGSGSQRATGEALTAPSTEWTHGSSGFLKASTSQPVLFC